MAENDAAHTPPEHPSDGVDSDTISSGSGQIATTTNTPTEFGPNPDPTFFPEHFEGAAVTSPSPSFTDIPAGSMVSDSEQQQEQGVFVIPPGFSPDILLDSLDSFPAQGPFEVSNQEALGEVTAEANFDIDVSFLAELDPELEFDLSGSFQFPTLTSEPMQQNVTSCTVNNAGPSQPYSMIVDEPPDDGYNWRKKKQEQVQESKVSRSYYKCRARRCPVRKKVEQSLDVQVMKICYKNVHNHPPPPRLPRYGGSQGMSELAPQSARGKEPSQAIIEKLSSAGEEVGNDANRITQEQGASQMGVAEQKCIIQTTSEVDFLDDGYRWQMYEQKHFEGNPNLRSSYRCTHQGCNVRRHIERVATDPNKVLTTYEGRHNHHVPAADVPAADVPDADVPAADTII